MSAMAESELINGARGGSEPAFKELVSNYARELQLHAYKMLGSYHDAEDAWQEALLKAWNGIRQFRGEGTFRAWLYKITTNVCLEELKKRKRRPLPTQLYADTRELTGAPVPVEGVAWFEPIPEGLYAHSGAEKQENVKIAFLVSLQLLTPAQRAMLILRDILDFSASETAKMLGTTEPSVNSSLLRARKRLAAELKRTPQDATVPGTPSHPVKVVLERLLACWNQQDVPGIVSLLKSDAEFSMPPFKLWLKGTAMIGGFLAAVVFQQKMKFLPTAANGQPALAGYVYSPEEKCYLPQSLLVFSLAEDGQVNSLISFLFPHLFKLFALPDRLT
jgi:RNA polymerase sigma-70 factor, ECF subfamily